MTHLIFDTLGTPESVDDVDDPGNDAVATVTSDFSLNLMFIVLLASASLVADQRMNLDDVDLHAVQGAGGELPQHGAEPLRITIDSAGAVTLGQTRMRPCEVDETALVGLFLTAIDGKSPDDIHALIAPDAAAPWRSVAAVNLALENLTSHYHTVYHNATGEGKP